MPTTISPVQTGADKRAFYNFAWRVYRSDPNWVPHLWPQRKEYLDKKAAFFTYGEGDFLLAKRGREVVGTIGMAIDHARNRDTGERVAIFGFFEALDFEAAAAMWDHACEWGRKRGMTLLLGPHSFTPNDDAGFLIEGFDTMPAILMGHSPPHYAAFAERYGFEQGQISLAYRIDLAQYDFDAENAPPVIHSIAARALRRYGPGAVRLARLEEWDEEIGRLHPVYNRSLSVLPDFAPIELAEFEAQALALKPILDPELVFIAELDGRVVGFGLGIPNIAEAFRWAGGLRYPWDYLRFALAQRRITGVSFKILAIDPDYWGYGLDAIMYLEMGRAVIRKGYTWIDASLTGDTNPQTNKLAGRMGAQVYRRYREYRLEL